MKYLKVIDTNNYIYIPCEYYFGENKLNQLKNIFLKNNLFLNKNLPLEIIEKIFFYTLYSINYTNYIIYEILNIDFNYFNEKDINFNKLLTDNNFKICYIEKVSIQKRFYLGHGLKTIYCIVGKTDYNSFYDSVSYYNSYSLTNGTYTIDNVLFSSNLSKYNYFKYSNIEKENIIYKNPICLNIYNKFDFVTHIMVHKYDNSICSDYGSYCNSSMKYINAIPLTIDLLSAAKSTENNIIINYKKWSLSYIVNIVNPFYTYIYTNDGNIIINKINKDLGEFVDLNYFLKKIHDLTLYE